MLSAGAPRSARPSTAQLVELFRPEAALGVADSFIARALLRAAERGTPT